MSRANSIDRTRVPQLKNACLTILNPRQEEQMDGRDEILMSPFPKNDNNVL